MTCQNRFLFVVLLESIDFIVCVHHCKGELSEENVKMMVMQRPILERKVSSGESRWGFASSLVGRSEMVVLNKGIVPRTSDFNCRSKQLLSVKVFFIFTKKSVPSVRLRG